MLTDTFATKMYRSKAHSVKENTGRTSQSGGLEGRLSAFVFLPSAPLLPYWNFTCGTWRAAAGTSKYGCSLNPRVDATRFPGNWRTATL